MSSVCITTVVSGDTYCYYIPIFVYAAKRAYPSYHIKVFMHGDIKSNVAEFIEGMKRYVPAGFEIIPNAFPDMPHNKYSYNALRFIVPDKHFKKFDFVYITDIDFLIFHHKPTLKQHYFDMMTAMGQPCVMARGPAYYPRRKSITKRGWKGKYTRMGGGRVFLKWPEWAKKTAKIRDKYTRVALQNTHDNYDKHVFGSYREYDEVMLCRICKRAKIPVPRVVGKSLLGRGLDNLYRDIHLGDFTKSARAHKHGKLTRRVKDNTVNAYLDMEKERGWQTVKEFSCQSNTIRQALRRLNKHIKLRGFAS